jgi:hypothetical protein
MPRERLGLKREEGGEIFYTITPVVRGTTDRALGHSSFIEQKMVKRSFNRTASQEHI